MLNKVVDEPALLKRLPNTYDPTADELLERFLSYCTEQKLELYPAQEEAILELLEGKNIILNTPTGSGKSLVAKALHFKGLAEGRRSVYTCPIKALVNEKFFDLCREFGPENVGMMTGDATVNRDALILCCTAEILANAALREGEQLKVDYVIMDEFHYYSDRERGVAWQVPLLTMPQARYLLMSATLGATEFFEKAVTDLTGKPTITIRSAQRPVPLHFHYSEIPLHEELQSLVVSGKAPVYLVCFTQRACAEQAQNLLSVDFCSKDEKKAIAEALVGAKFTSPYGKDLQKYLKHGIGLHHAGLLPRYRLLVEKLAQQGLLKIICGTDTLGVGVNIPIRTVLFTQLCKFDGEKTIVLSVRDFQQIAGRAGRKGYDTEGFVVAQAPEYVIDNLRMEQKAAGDAKKLKKIVRKRPPEKGFVNWNRETFERLQKSQPEPLVSRFQVSHGMILNVLGRPQSGCRALKKLIRSAHERPAIQRQQGKLAFQMFRSLVSAQVIEFVKKSEEEGGGKKLVINGDLQRDFSMNHSLSLYVIDTLDRIDPMRDTYALDVLSLCESILENPDLILRKQLDRIKGEKVAEMKAAGVEYDDRMAELEKLEYPKPNAEFIYATYNEFVKKHPWVGAENIRPKSVARDMYEMYASFSDYIKEYELQRSEGILLRYLSDAYRTLAQTVPDLAKNEEVFAIASYLKEMLRSVDSSLLDEWERMRRGEPLLAKVEQAVEEKAEDITTDRRAFMVLVRNELFRFIRTLSIKDYAAGVEMLYQNPKNPWTVERLEKTLQPFYEQHPGIRVDPQARSPKNTTVRESEDRTFWQIDQMIIPKQKPTMPIAAVAGDEHYEDPDAVNELANDWVIEIDVDLLRAKELGRVEITLIDIHDLAEREGQ